MHCFACKGFTRAEPSAVLTCDDEDFNHPRSLHRRKQFLDSVKESGIAALSVQFSKPGIVAFCNRRRSKFNFVSSNSASVNVLSLVVNLSFLVCYSTHVFFAGRGSSRAEGVTRKLVNRGVDVRQPLSPSVSPTT